MKHQQAIINNRKIIAPPDKLCIYDPSHRIPTLNFLDLFTKIAIREKQNIEVDLSNLSDITASAALLLFAETTATQLITNNADSIRFKLPKDKGLKKQFRDTSLFSALKPGLERKLDNLWKTNSNFQSGTNPEKCIEPTIRLLENTSREKVPKKLNTAISEAMLNVTHHAYRAFRNTPSAIDNRWWQYCFIKDGRLAFLIYDRGSGIAQGVRYAKNTPAVDDCDLIAAAMSKGFSRFNIQGRGQGSEDMKKPAQYHKEDYLAIMSNKGRYLFSSKEKEPLVQNLAYSFRGTLAEWSFAINNHS